jgi:hypothetical protein
MDSSFLGEDSADCEARSQIRVNVSWLSITFLPSI